jgi:hypothetical protein
MTGLVKNSSTCEEKTVTTSQWTPETIRALGATTDLPTLGSIFGLGRWRSYQMAHTGEWEQAGIRIIQIGARYRVTVQSILDVLTHGSTPGTGMSREEAAPSPMRQRETRQIAAASWQHPARQRPGTGNEQPA